FGSSLSPIKLTIDRGSNQKEPILKRDNSSTTILLHLIIYIAIRKKNSISPKDSLVLKFLGRNQALNIYGIFTNAK
ncbi:MAG: hypothetical protein MUO40_12890, partial [Anaerolineaceae bacterium]|nr:hypothetical protein [Anaerolineaceae bacterium]